MKILYFKRLESTQSHIKENIEKYNKPTLIYTNSQTKGIGSRENKWIGEDGNLFFSFVVSSSYFNISIPLSSLSIYIGFYIQKVLSSMGSMVFLKWPNDLYIKDKKIAGIITWSKKNKIIVGCGINTKENKIFQNLDININDKIFLEKLIYELDKKESWEVVFLKYEKAFYENKSFVINHNNKKVSLKECKLQKDGSIMTKGEKIFSCR